MAERSPLSYNNAMADITRPIEPFELTQAFGENPANYAKFGLKGHNGWDFRTKLDDTPKGQRNILASWLMEFYRQGVDPTGYGNFLETVCKLKSTWKLTYAHCLTIESFVKKNERETMAISDSTGNSTGNHLHLTVKRITITNGVHQVIDYNNGYFGAVEPQEFFDELRQWKLSGKKPTTEGGLTMQVDDATFKMLVAKSTNRDELYDQLGVPRDPVEPTTDKPRAVIEGYKNLATGLQRQLDQKAAELTNKEEQVDRIKQTYEASAKTDGERIAALEKAQSAWEKERELLKGQVDGFAKDKGELTIALATQTTLTQEWKTKAEQAAAGSAASLNLGDVLVLLFKKAFTIKLK